MAENNEELPFVLSREIDRRFKGKEDIFIHDEDAASNTWT